MPRKKEVAVWRQGGGLVGFFSFLVFEMEREDGC